jgi:hypothetical protein
MHTFCPDVGLEPPDQFVPVAHAVFVVPVQFTSQAAACAGLANRETGISGEASIASATKRRLDVLDNMECSVQTFNGTLSVHGKVMSSVFSKRRGRDVSLQTPFVFSRLANYLADRPIFQANSSARRYRIRHVEFTNDASIS